jgi:hypothetical protein
MRPTARPQPGLAGRATGWIGGENAGMPSISSVVAKPRPRDRGVRDLGREEASANPNAE